MHGLQLLVGRDHLQPIDVLLEVLELFHQRIEQLHIGAVGAFRLARALRIVIADRNGTQLLYPLTQIGGVLLQPGAGRLQHAFLQRDPVHGKLG